MLHVSPMLHVANFACFFLRMLSLPTSPLLFKIAIIVISSKCAWHSQQENESVTTNIQNIQINFS